MSDYYKKKLNNPMYTTNTIPLALNVFGVWCVLCVLPLPFFAVNLHLYRRPARFACFFAYTLQTSCTHHYALFLSVRLRVCAL